MIAIRPAVPADAERIADIRMTGWRETYAHLLSADLLERRTSDPDRIRTSIESGTPVVVAELDRDVVGFACASTPLDREPDPPRDLQLWFVEGRDYRSPNRMRDGPEKSIWGAEQRAWLQSTLRESDATFKIVASSNCKCSMKRWPLSMRCASRTRRCRWAFAYLIRLGIKASLDWLPRASRTACIVRSSRWLKRTNTC